MAWNVACRTGIAVLEPHAAKFMAALDDGVGNARLGQFDRGAQAGNAPADDQRGKARRYGVRPLPRWFPFEPKLVADHRDIGGGNILAERHTHHFAQ